MSRIGKKKVLLPDNVKVSFTDKKVIIKGEKGSLTRDVHQGVDLKIENKELSIIKLNDDKKTDALQGLTRSLIANMVTGVSKGFERTLEVNGVGYRVEIKGDTIVFSLGYSNPVNFKLPSGISAAADKNILRIKGIDKELLGQTAASIRRLRLPEPYKGKGIKYQEEFIQKKAGKTGAK
ncbi:MAG: 50S ribosomal protein L6 [Desulfobacterales bacterium]|nr:50S ribosomal protein L6 [Desulfobacterales bacterium]MBF0396459.1 50S ribosomal protein L6 [Desulfobacterales bacterium]